MEKEHYTVAELFTMLQEDDSWEKDSNERARLIASYKLILSVWFC